MASKVSSLVSTATMGPSRKDWVSSWEREVARAGLVGVDHGG